MTSMRLTDHSCATLRALFLLATLFVVLSNLALLFMDPLTAAILLMLALPVTIVMARLARALIALEGARD